MADAGRDAQRGDDGADGAAAAPRPRALTPKALLTGLALVLVLAAAIPWNDWALENTQLYNNYLPPVVTVCVLGIVLVLNPWLGRYRYRRGELVVIVVMLLGLGGVVSGGLIRTLPITMSAPARHLSQGAKFEPLKVRLSPEELAAQRAAASELVAAELRGYDVDGDGRTVPGEFPVPERGAAMDADGDGALGVDEVLDYRASYSDSLLAPWRWPLSPDLTVGVPSSGPIPTADPEYRHVVDGYLDGLPAPAVGEPQRVRHRSRVTWRDPDGVVHERELALAGRARDQQLYGDGAGGVDGTVLDLDDPVIGSHLAGKRAGETVRLGDGRTIEVLDVEPPRVPWYAWLGPLVHWAPLLVGAFVAMIALAGVVRRQWLHHERLPYPIAEVTLSLMQEPTPGRRYPDLFYQRGFWAAFTVVALIITWRGLHAYQLVPIDFKMSLNLWWTVLKGEPWSRMPVGYWLARPTLWFSIIAMAFFMTLRVSFSLWFTFLLGNFLFAYLAMAGVPVDKDDYYESTVGGFGAMVCVVLWLGRRYYWQVVKAAVGLERSEAAREAAPYLWALLLGSGTMVAWLVLQGADLAPSLLLVLVFLGLLLVLSRIVAESGMPFVQTGPKARICPILFSSIGLGVGPGALLPLALVGMALGADNREALMPYAVNASAIGDQGGVRPRRLSLVMLGAAVIGTAVAFFAMLSGGYLGGGASVDNWGVDVTQRFVLNPPTEVVEAAGSEADLERVQDLRADRYVAWASGAGVVGLLGWLRMVVSWWPLHPIGFLMMGSWCVMITWASFLMGWMWKGLVMRYGGVGLYQRLKPVAIGMIAGEAVTVFAFMLVRLVAQGFGAELPEFKMLPQ